MMKLKFFCVIAAAGAASVCPARAEDGWLGTQIVDAMNKIFGVHPGMRATHAKGVVTEGVFKASPDAAALSRSPLFTGAAIPVTVRFSDSTGIPNLPDGSPLANPHGMAVKYHLPNNEESDMVLNAFRFFPVSNGGEFRDMLLAQAASPPDAPKPTKFDEFLDSHPQAAAALASLRTPDSFADEEYNSVNAFVFVNKAGEKQAVRYRMTPEREVYLDPAGAVGQQPDVLVNELSERLARGPVTFHFKAQLAAPGDSTADPARPWPESRKVVDLGELTISKAVPDSVQAQKALLFLPGRVTDGIELSDDPLIALRDDAYTLSFSRRTP